MRTPKGLAEADFRQALQEFANVVGHDWVFADEADVDLYTDSYDPFFDDPAQSHWASAAVAPSKVEEVQAVVRIANKYKVPLHPISTGRNLGYGGSSPHLQGAVVLDLKRMNRIIEVNEADCYMIVEPGVSFIDLQKYLDDNHIDLVPSSPQPGWGSPIGNGLDHGVGGAWGDNFSAVTGMEVVLADGEILRTGSGGLADARLWGKYHYGFGPWIDGLFSQSNFGIVTKACFSLAPRWEASQGFTVTSYNDDDLQPMIDGLKHLVNRGILRGMGVGSPLRQSTATNDGRHGGGPEEAKLLLRRRDGGTKAQWEALARKVRMPVAAAGGSWRGPAPLVKEHIDYAVDWLKRNRIPGEISVGQQSTSIKPPMIDFGELALSGTSRGHYYFSPIFEVTQKDIFALNDTVRNVMLDMNDIEMLDETGWWASRGYAGGDTGKYIMILMEFRVFDDREKNRRRRELFLRLVKECGQRGWGEYRGPVYFNDAIMDQYSFNNHSLRRFYEKIYDALDPNGVIGPGKSGIWPKSMRKA